MSAGKPKLWFLYIVEAEAFSLQRPSYKTIILYEEVYYKYNIFF